MEMTKQDRLTKLLNAYSHHYDIERDVDVEGGHFPATAFYYLRDENIDLADHLTAEDLQRKIDLSRQAGMSHIKPNKEHMSSFVTLVVLADTIDPEAKALIRKTRFRKNFRLALHGWMEYRIAAMEIATNSFLSNPAAKEARKLLEANFAPKKH